MEDVILTIREKEIFELLVQDKTTKEIAELLFISDKTVRNHISNVIQKLGVKERVHAICKLVRLGILRI
ncbi:LuxR C-terminal-related transcriptional regulator [Bacillus sp. MUM 116]|uniref:helix-turn-helix domain-containing protein n=1 Tax=Bacillus sp. MUM 116 TaxID=1678002 RepID=UPI000A93CB65